MDQPLWQRDLDAARLIRPGQSRQQTLRWNIESWVQVPGDNTGAGGLGFELTVVAGMDASGI